MTLIRLAKSSCVPYSCTEQNPTPNILALQMCVLLEKMFDVNITEIFPWDRRIDHMLIAFSLVFLKQCFTAIGTQPPLRTDRFHIDKEYFDVTHSFHIRCLTKTNVLSNLLTF